MKRPFLLAFSLLTFIGCNNPADESLKSEGVYFDIKGYFKNEAKRLTKENPRVNKTVGINGSKEVKNVVVADWNTELGMFIDAEINRKSWEGLFETTKDSNSVKYASVDDKIPVKSVGLFYSGDRLTCLNIIVETNNMLYDSTDSLIYYPDSLYQIKKHQKIRFLPEKKYLIEGKLK